MAGLTACGFGSLPRLMTGEGGSVTVVAAVSITMLIYCAAVALDLANLYYNKSIDQRIADQSAIAAAFTYASTGSTATAQTAASSLALANGVASAGDVVTTFGLSPLGDGRTAAQVVVTSQMPLTGPGRMITATKTQTGGDISLNVGATAWAEVHESTPCILALASPGIPMTGGTHIAATNCSVVSDNAISLSSGPTLTASSIQAVGSITNTNGTINGPQYPNSSTTADPYKNSQVFARLPTVLSEAESLPIFPSMPSAPPSGNYTSCSSGTLTLTSGTNYGYVVGSGTCTINFSGSGTYSMQGLTVSSGTVTINMPSATYKIGDNSSTGIVFTAGTGTVNITGSPNIYLYGPIASTGGTGTINGTANWYVSGGINISSTGTVSISNTGSTTSTFYTADVDVSAASSKLVLPNGTYTITGSSTLGGLTVAGSATFGNGSFIIEDGISVGGGGTLTIGSALSGSSVFEVFASSPGTSCSGTAIYSAGHMLSIGNFNYFDICGQFIDAGSMTLGSGAYTIYGEFDLAQTGGGSVTGTNVSIVANGPILFGQGITPVSLDAPTAITSSSEGGTQTVAIASSTSSASTITQGATGTGIVGLVYLPNSPLTINGGGNLTGGGNCLQVIANSISMSGGGSLTTNCSSLGTGSSGAVTLVE